MSSRDQAAACPFCEYAGPSEVVYDTGDVFVIEPLNPVTEGHFIVIPREHVEDAAQDPVTTGRVFEVAAEFAGTEPFNLITSRGEEATQTVRHLHVHYVPRRAGDGLALPWSNRA